MEANRVVPRKVFDLSSLQFNSCRVEGLFYFVKIFKIVRKVL